MEVVKIGWRYAIRNSHGDYWWRGSYPNWTGKLSYCTKFWFSQSAINKARSFAAGREHEVVWKAGEA